MSKSNTPHNDPALGSFIRYIEQVALCARLDYIKHSGLIHDREIITDTPPDYSSGVELLEALHWGMTEISADIVLHTAICNLTAKEKQTIALSILEDRSMEETSELLHISLGRTYQLRRKALGKLRKAVQGGEHDDSN